MSDYQEGDRVRRRGDAEGAEPWIVKRVPPVGGIVIGRGEARAIVSRSELERSDGPAATLRVPPPPPPPGMTMTGAPAWLWAVVTDLMEKWGALWRRQPPQLHSIELASIISAKLAADWVLQADPALLRELATDDGGDPRSQAIGALVGVLLQIALQEPPDPAPQPA